MSNNAYLIYKNSGEIIKEFDTKEYYLRSKASDEGYKKYRSTAHDNRNFSFADMENIREVINNISTVRCGYLLILQCYMEFETGKLTIARKGMPRALGASESTFIRFWNEVRKNGIVTEKDGLYYINSRFHFRQQPKSKRIIKLFTTRLKRLKDELTPSELGFLYKLLPYVHYDTNMICADPFTSPQDIQFLNKTQIALLLNMDEKKSAKVLDKLRKAGVLAETIRQDDKRDRIFTLNPYVFYRKAGQPDDSLRALFKATPYSSK